MKFGKIDVENLKMTHYSKDSTVSAVVLCDYGEAAIRYNTTLGFQVVFDRHTRIKIFSKEGYEWADEEIFLYQSPTSSGKEVVGLLKGVTYNWEEGKVTKTKLTGKSIFEEKYDSENNIKKFTLPNVKEGSIIEYKYTLTSDFTFNFQSWEFQKSIPVLWSEFRTAIPEYFTYEKGFQGYLPVDIDEPSQSSNSINFQTITRDNTTSATTSTVELTKIPYVEKRNRWVIKNAPAFVSESYMTTDRNYISKVRFELASTKMPNQPIKRVMGTWDNINTKFLENSYFGLKVKGSGFLKKEVEVITANLADDNAKIEAIYNFVKSNIKWDGRSRRYLDFNLKKPFDEKKGSSSEVNLILTSMLQKAGIVADPVLISTRSNGIIRQAFPLSSQFNYVICKVTLGDRHILLDATDPYLPMNILPKRCLNGQGWVVSENNSGWIPVVSTQRALTQVSGNLVISEDGVLSGDLTTKYRGYDSRSPRRGYFVDGEEKYISNLMDESKWEITEISLENADDLSSSFIEKYLIDEMEAAENLGGKIYLQPIVSNEWDENPFKTDERKYPVDFAMPWSEQYFVHFTIPEGYEVEEFPKSRAIVLPEGTGKFMYKVTLSENKISVLNTLDIKKSVFYQPEYATLKEFFAQIIAMQKEQIILRRL